MKKQFLLFTLFAASVSFAQKASNTITFTKGQKLEVVTTTNIQAQTMMGPTSGNVTVADVYAVNDVTPAGTTLVKAPKGIKIAFTSGSQEIKMDSDNPKDLNGPLGEPIKEIMNYKPEFTIDAAGKVVAVKNDGKKKETARDAGMMAMMMPGMNLAAAIPREGSPSVFQVLPNQEVGVGDTWTDSVNLEGNKSITTYKVKEITEKEIVLDLEGMGTTITSQSVMGQTIDVNATTKGTGRVIIDRTTGIMKQKMITNTTETAMNFAGRDMTSTAKTTSVMNVSVQ